MDRFLKMYQDHKVLWNPKMEFAEIKIKCDIEYFGTYT